MEYLSQFWEVLSRYDIAGAYWTNIQLAIFAIVFSLILGLFLAVMRISPVPSFNVLGSLYVTLVRNTPLTVFVVFAVLALWPVLGIEFSSSFSTNFFWLAVLALSVYHASFMCEAFRSGVNTVPTGQVEAARAIGLGFGPSVRLVILPQAFRGAIAPLGNTVIALIKNTTVAAAASVPEIAVLMRGMIENHGNYAFMIFLTVAAGFVILVIPIGLLTTFLSRRLAVSR